MTPSRVMQQDYRADTVIEAMQEYADQELASLQQELTDLKAENSMLAHFINSPKTPNI